MWSWLQFTPFLDLQVAPRQRPKLSAELQRVILIEDHLMEHIHHHRHATSSQAGTRAAMTPSCKTTRKLTPASWTSWSPVETPEWQRVRQFRQPLSVCRKQQSRRPQTASKLKCKNCQKLVLSTSRGPPPAQGQELRPSKLRPSWSQLVAELTPAQKGQGRIHAVHGRRAPEHAHRSHRAQY